MASVRGDVGPGKARSPWSPLSSQVFDTCCGLFKFFCRGAVSFIQTGQIFKEEGTDGGLLTGYSRLYFLCCVCVWGGILSRISGSGRNSLFCRDLSNISSNISVSCPIAVQLQVALFLGPGRRLQTLLLVCSPLLRNQNLWRRTRWMETRVDLQSLMETSKTR